MTPAEVAAMRAGAPSRSSVWRRGLHARLDALREGTLLLRDAGGDARFGDGGALDATVTIHDDGVYRRLALAGALGAGLSYVDGAWSSPDLTATLRLFLRNGAVLERFDGPLSALFTAAACALHAWRTNTRRGSRRNIAAHYDLSNDFFALMLDPSMMYSCALFGDGDDLAAAQTRKLDAICDTLALGADDEVVEIGSGWGGFAVHAARTRGCRVTTVTISQGQYAVATERVRAAGLDGRVEVLLCDYRDLPARLGRRVDKLVSIEMIEAVGDRHLEAYCATLGRLLAPHGFGLIQAITIPDAQYAAYLRRTDFIRHVVFPGSSLVSVRRFLGALSATTSLQLAGLRDITAHYPPTLRAWRQRLEARRDAVRALGFDERFWRMWEFYLCSCEAGFAERAFGNVQMLLAGPRAQVST